MEDNQEVIRICTAYEHLIATLSQQFIDLSTKGFVEPKHDSDFKQAAQRVYTIRKKYGKVPILRR